MLFGVTVRSHTTQKVEVACRDRLLGLADRRGAILAICHLDRWRWNEASTWVAILAQVLVFSPPTHPSKSDTALHHKTASARFWAFAPSALPTWDGSAIMRMPALLRMGSATQKWAASRRQDSRAYCFTWAAVEVWACMPPAVDGFLLLVVAMCVMRLSSMNFVRNPDCSCCNCASLLHDCCLIRELPCFLRVCNP